MSLPLHADWYQRWQPPMPASVMVKRRTVQPSSRGDPVYQETASGPYPALVSFYAIRSEQVVGERWMGRNFYVVRLGRDVDVRHDDLIVVGDRTFRVVSVSVPVVFASTKRVLVTET